MRLNISAPNPRQDLFLHDNHKYVAFGGARGGGKSWAVRIKALMLCARYPGIKVMLIRRTYPELRANHIEPLRALIGTRMGRYNDSKKEYVFLNGSVIMFRYCADERDMDNYQGTEADIIFIDEATQFDEKVFLMFAACLRGVNEFPKQIFLTCNPGGKGHGWVKRLFIDKKYKDTESPEDYSFIQSLVTDNRALMESQPDYIKQLEALPPRLREAWLYGNWDIFEGQFFEEFCEEPNRELCEKYGITIEEAKVKGMFTHVIEPFTPPKHWRRYRSFDFGYAKPFSCGWWAVSPDGEIYRILEMYGCTKTPDEGVKWTPDRIFSEIARVEREHPYLKGQEIWGIADPSIWDASRGEAVSDTAAKYGIYFAPGDNKRIPGWMQVHYRLAFDENGKSMMQIFKTCKAFIRTIPLLTYSETRPEDCDTTQEDHVADEVRYMCMARPITPREAPEEPAKEYDPLDIDWGNEGTDRLKIFEI